MSAKSTSTAETGMVRRVVRIVRLAALIALLALPVAGAVAGSVHAQQTPSAAQEGFVPVDQLPADEQLPAAPLLIAAYAVAWVVVLGYLWSIWQRLGRVERDLGEVRRRIDAGARR